MKIESKDKLSAQQKGIYIMICEFIWGCVPVDYDWAVQTQLYKTEISALSEFITNDLLKDVPENTINRVFQSIFKKSKR